MTFRIVMADFNAKFTYDQTAMGHDERHRVRLDPKEQFEVQRISYSGSPGQARIYLAGLTSDLVDITVDTEIRSAILGLTDQLCETQADSPTYLYQTDFEMGEDDPPGLRGSTAVDIASYCGKKSFLMNSDDPRLYYTDNEDEMADVNTHRYMCFAVRGNIETTMRIQFRWKDKYGNGGRTDTLVADHGLAATADTWSSRLRRLACPRGQFVVEQSPYCRREAEGQTRPGAASSNSQRQRIRRYLRLCHRRHCRGPDPTIRPEERRNLSGRRGRDGSGK
ncbi:uncharacterized protein LOC119572245 [Penaeus monodon]|uniref:uncharacterized protein LOC119572245 n=1 Tax=Penaeus monodon TaxID=6687 RepID=UPI0018A76E1B|nr:uncharacterized protein LOC119572245 [Penaeus monodon]